MKEMIILFFGSNSSKEKIHIVYTRYQSLIKPMIKIKYRNLSFLVFLKKLQHHLIRIYVDLLRIRIYHHSIVWIYSILFQRYETIFLLRKGIKYLILKRKIDCVKTKLEQKVRLNRLVLKINKLKKGRTARS